MQASRQARTGRLVAQAGFVTLDGSHTKARCACRLPADRFIAKAETLRRQAHRASRFAQASSSWRQARCVVRLGGSRRQARHAGRLVAQARSSRRLACCAGRLAQAGSRRQDRGAHRLVTQTGSHRKALPQAGLHRQDRCAGRLVANEGSSREALFPGTRNAPQRLPAKRVAHTAASGCMHCVTCRGPPRVAASRENQRRSQF